MKGHTVASLNRPAQADGIRAPRQWHAVAARDSLELLDTIQEGLTQAEAAERLVEHGANTIGMARPDGPLRLLLRQLNSPLLFVLLGSGGIALLGVGTIIVLQLGFVYLPFMQDLFGSAPLEPEAWLRAFLVGAAVWPVVAIEKAVRRHRERRSHTGARQRALPESGGGP